MNQLKELLKSFNDGKLPKSGVISYYGHYIGKPGDTISTIANISIEESKLSISLGRDLVKLICPEGIIYSESKIEVSTAKEVYFNDNKIDINSKEKAFVLFTW